MSDDEDLMPDQSTFVGLFRPQPFKSLLHKTKNTTRLGTIQTDPDTAMALADPADPLCAEPTIEMEEVPTPKLLVDIVQRQWTAPRSGPNPSSLDRHF